jgi:hypothetical protein
MSNQVDFQIKFTAIELVAKSLEPPTAPLEKENVDFDFSVDIKVAEQKKEALVLTDISILRHSDKAKMAFFKLLTVFEIVNFEEVFKKVDEHRYDLPLQLEILLKSAGLSTVRGVIYSELRGTYLQNAVLPLIDIAGVIIENRKKAEESKKQKVS